MVVSRCADVAGGVGRPGDAVNTGAVVVEPGDGSAGNSHVQDDNLACVHRHRGQVVRVLLVPS